MPIWKKNFTLDQLNQMRTKVEDYIDFHFTNFGDNYLEGKMQVSESVVQPFGLLHGGISCVIAELMGSVGSNLCIVDPQKAVGMNLQAQHLKPMPKGANITAMASPVRLGKRQHVWTINLRNDADELCAQIIFAAAVLPE